MAWETPSKMAIVAFKRRADINTLGSIIEHHHKVTDEWPDFRNMTFTSGPTKKNTLELLDVYEWTDIDELKNFCCLRYFDLILVDTITASFKIKGNVYSLEIPVQEHIPYLNNLLNEND